MWDLVPWPGIKPEASVLGVRSLSHWTGREVPLLFKRVAFLIGLTSCLSFIIKLSAEEKVVFEVFRAYMTYMCHAMNIYRKVPDLMVVHSKFSALLASWPSVLDSYCNLIPHLALWMTVSNHYLNLRHLSRSQS